MLKLLISMAVAAIVVLAIACGGNSLDKDRACLRDADCIAENAGWRIDAEVHCKRVVENRAKNTHRWTDGWGERKFSRVAIQPPSYESAKYSGSAVEFQNGFGAWQRMAYTCSYDPINEQVLDVDVLTFN